MATVRFAFALALLALCATLAPRPAAAQTTSGPYIGEIMIFAFSFCPVGWAATNGALLPISGNATLFALLGTTYGGDGATNFALPNWKPPLAANGGSFTTCIALQGVYPTSS